MAEYLAKHAVADYDWSQLIEFSSCGLMAFTGDSASQEAIITLQDDFNIDMTAHRSREATGYLLEEADLILTMGSSHRQNILSVFPEFAFTCRLLCPEDIADPYGGDLNTYKLCAKQISECIAKYVSIFDKLFAMQNK